MSTIFFSWQSDTTPQVGKSFIEKALEKAIKELQREATLKVVEPERNNEIKLDKDTQNIPGSPPIFDTILRKIEECSAFVADLTYVSERKSGALSPNPNVLIEYGWALRSRGYERLIGVMNTAFGSPQNSPLPFDLRHSRNPIQFHLSDTAGSGEKTNVLARLVHDFKLAIKAILEIPENQATAQFEEFSPTPATDGMGRFRQQDVPIGIQYDEYSIAHRNVFLSSGPAIWLRLRPKFNSGRLILSTEILEKIRESQFKLCLLVEYQSSGLLRGEDGFGRYVYQSDSDQTPGIAYVFHRGEIWISDVSGRTEEGILLFHERSIIECFVKNIDFYKNHLQMPLPLIWEAGIEGIQGLNIYKSSPDYSHPHRSYGPALCNFARSEGEINDDVASSNDALRPFIEAVYDAFGIKPPEWLFSTT